MISEQRSPVLMTLLGHKMMSPEKGTDLNSRCSNESARQTKPQSRGIVKAPNKEEPDLINKNSVKSACESASGA